MSQPYGNQLYDQFLSLQTAATDERVFSLAPPQLLDFAISGYEYDSSSGCSSYVHSPTSNSTTYGAQSPTLLNTNLEGYHKYNNIHMKSESSYGIAESTQVIIYSFHPSIVHAFIYLIEWYYLSTNAIAGRTRV